MAKTTTPANIAAPVTSAPPTAPVVPSQNSIRNALPTAIVFSLLCVIAIWGYSTEWTFIRSAASESDPSKLAWCDDHNVSEADCIECNQELAARDKDHGWCKTHGVADCPFENPDVIQLAKISEVTPADLERANRALALLPRNENNSRCTLHTKRIQFASTEALDKAGVDIAIAMQRPIVEAITANGEVVYDETMRASLASRVAGTVWRVQKEVGDQVSKGEILAIVESAEVGRAKSEFLESIAKVRVTQTNAEKLRSLSGASVAARSIRDAEAAAEEARIHLLSAEQALVNLGFQIRADHFAGVATEEIARRIKFLGLASDTTAGIDADSASSNLYPLRAPLDGIVIARKAVVGEVVDTASPLFAVANIRQMWLMLDVRHDDAKHMAAGQTVLFRPSDTTNEPEVKGDLTWISTEVNDNTRTVKARVNLPNADGRLRANTFGAARIVLREEPKATVIPTEAIHWDGCCNVVFVRDKNFLQPNAYKFFHVRKVRLGVNDGQNTEIIAGLMPDEVIAAKNSVVLEAQLLKSNLGAGCCDVDPGKK